MTVSFALLESTVHTLISFLIGGTGPVVCNYISFGRLSEATKAVYRVRFGEDVRFKELEGLMSSIEELNRKRNQITHSLWTPGLSSETVRRFNSKVNTKMGLHWEFEPYDELKIAAISREMKVKAEEIQDFFISLYAPSIAD